MTLQQSLAGNAVCAPGMTSVLPGSFLQQSFLAEGDSVVEGRVAGSAQGRQGDYHSTSVSSDAAVTEVAATSAPASFAGADDEEVQGADVDPASEPGADVQVVFGTEGGLF